MSKKTTYENDYQSLLGDLAEARRVLNKCRAERLKDSVGPFNPGLSMKDAQKVIKKSVRASYELVQYYAKERMVLQVVKDGTGRLHYEKFNVANFDPKLDNLWIETTKEDVLSGKPISEEEAVEGLFFLDYLAGEGLL